MDVEKVLVTEEEIKEICRRLGEQISRDYAGKKLLLVSVLKGAVVYGRPYAKYYLRLPD